MKLRNVWVIFSILALACLLCSQVSAGENIDYFNNSTKISFEGVDFMIPEGFGEYKDVEKFTGLGSDGKTTSYINETNGKIVITVISDWMGISVDEFKTNNSKKATIDGHSGWKYSEDDLNYFGYVDGDKGILIGVTNETRLYEVVL